jgi:hypothetical protein
MSFSNYREYGEFMAKEFNYEDGIKHQKLSRTQQNVIGIMKEKGSLKRLPGGFWTYDDVTIKEHSFVPVWWCDVRTLRVLQTKGLVNLDELKRICTLATQ